MKLNNMPANNNKYFDHDRIIINVAILFCFLKSCIELDDQE